MSQLWTELIEPQELTGYIREAIADYEEERGTLARFLPNDTVHDIAVRFVVGQDSMVEEARWRAFDAEPEIVGAVKARRMSLELAALGQNQVISEYAQLRARHAPDEAVRNQILSTTGHVARAVADTVDRLRGVVLTTGRATVDQENFALDDDFGRDADLTVTAATPWSDTEADVLDELTEWQETYAGFNGEGAGILLGSSRALNALGRNVQFATALANGASRPGSRAEVNAALEAQGLPTLMAYDRRTFVGRIIPEDTVIFLPSGTAADQRAGTTFWGQTVTSTDASFGITPGEEPGIVAGVYRNPTPPMIAEVVSDAIALPVLTSPNRTLAAKVL